MPNRVDPLRAPVQAFGQRSRRCHRLPACRTGGEGFAIPTFDLVPSDVEGFMEALWEFPSAFHDGFARSESRAHFFDSMVGQCSKLARKSIEPMALEVEGGTIRGLQRFVTHVQGVLVNGNDFLLGAYPESDANVVSWTEMSLLRAVMDSHATPSGGHC